MISTGAPAVVGGSYSAQLAGDQRDLHRPEVARRHHAHLRRRRLARRRGRPIVSVAMPN